MKLKQSVTIAAGEYITINGICFSHGMVDPLETILNFDHSHKSMQKIFDQVAYFFMMIKEEECTPMDFDYVLLNLRLVMMLLQEATEVKLQKGGKHGS